MNKCPICKEWTLVFDEYFGRVRCFNPECSWMPASGAEREIKLANSYQRPQEISSISLEELGLTLKVAYDCINDSLLFDFRLGEPTFELPEPDGIMVWKIGRETGSVAGFIVLEVKKLGISNIRVDIAARAAKKDAIEFGVKKSPQIMSSKRTSRLLIESVTVAADANERKSSKQETILKNAVDEAFKAIEASFADHDITGAEQVTA